MKKTLVRIVLTALFLIALGAIPVMGDTAPRPPLCPPHAVCSIGR